MIAAPGWGPEELYLMKEEVAEVEKRWPGIPYALAYAPAKDEPHDGSSRGRSKLTTKVQNFRARHGKELEAMRGERL